MKRPILEKIKSGLVGQIKEQTKVTGYNCKEKYYLAGSLILLPLFILTTICCATGNELPKTKEDTLVMNEQLKLEIELDKPVYKIEEPIIIECKIINLSKDTIKLHPILFMDLLVTLKYKDSSEIVPFGPKILLKELVRKDDIVELKSGEFHSYKKTISQETYIMPSKLGHYELYVIYNNVIKELDRIKLWVGEIKSNIVTFQMGGITNHKKP